MTVFKRGNTFWYKFRFAKREIRESAKTHSKTVAREAERQHRRELEEGINNLSERREERIQAISDLASDYLDQYRLRNRAIKFAEYAIGHVVDHFGKTLAVDICIDDVRRYQTVRLKEEASPKTINEEVGFLLRLLGRRGDALRLALKRENILKLRVRQTNGKAFTEEQKQALLKAAQPDRGDQTLAKTRSPMMAPVLVLALNTGMRASEIRTLTWEQINLERGILTVGRSKTDAGEGRTIPLNSAALEALASYAKWFMRRFGTMQPSWFVFPGRVGKPEPGKQRPLDPTRPVTSFKTAWKNTKKRAGVTGRFHDARHTLITELAEGGTGDQTIMDIAGHVSRQMLSRYSHIRTEAKRKALEAVATRSKRETVPSVDQMDATTADVPPSIN